MFFRKELCLPFSYLMVCVQTLKDARCKINIREILMSQQWTAQTEVFSITLEIIRIG